MVKKEKPPSPASLDSGETHYQITTESHGGRERRSLHLSYEIIAVIIIMPTTVAATATNI